MSMGGDASDVGSSASGGDDMGTDFGGASGTGGEPGEQCSCQSKNVCYEVGDLHPTFSCVICLESEGDARWGPAPDGVACDDGLYCTAVDACSSGICTGTGSVCDGVGCIEETDSCCTAEATLGCNEDGDVAWFDSCGNVGSMATDCEDSSQVCNGGKCECAEGWFGEDCSRCRIYVNGRYGSDEKDGHSWKNSLARFQTALALADALVAGPATEGCEIWLTDGTYYPSDEPSPEASFVLVPGVDVYGGFSGKETNVSQRDTEWYSTVLSGDVDRDGKLNAGNSRHVLIGADQVVLDGLAIRGGYVPDETVWNSTDTGAALWAVDVEMELRSLVVEDHRTGPSAGALWFSNSTVALQDSLLAGCTGAGLKVVDGFDVEVVDTEFLENSHGIYAYGSLSAENEVIVRRSNFRGNSTNSVGAGVFFYGESLTVEDSSFSTNEADFGSAIGIAGYAASLIKGCHFENNRATEANPSYGGTVFMSNSHGVRVHDSTFVGNTTETCGAAVCTLSGGEIHNTLFLHNVGTREWSTGAVEFVGREGRVDRSTFAFNESGGVGALANAEFVFNSVFANNSGSYGGALNFIGSIANSTFYGNHASTEGAVCWACGSIANSILWNNTSPDGELVAGSWHASYSDIQGGNPGEGNIDIDPMFVDPENGDFRLQVTSSCVDAGDTAVLPEDLLDSDVDGIYEEPMPYDRAGSSRVSGASVDMGAYEFGPP